MEQTVDLKKVYNELKKIKSTMITKEEMNSFLETISIVSNEDTMKQIQNSEQDIKDGKIREVNSSNDL